MCFTIDNTKRAPKKRVMWKVVRLLGLSQGWVTSLVQDHYYWGPGYHEIPKNANTTRIGGFTAHQGFYVYTSAQVALKSVSFTCYSGTMSIPLRVEVEPEDWLHSSRSGQIAAYRRVYVPENQPYLEWYDE